MKCAYVSMCNGMEFGTLISTGTIYFTVLNTKLEGLLVVIYVVYIYQSSFTNVHASINVNSSNKQLGHSNKQCYKQ